MTAPNVTASDLPRWLRAAVPVVGHILREDGDLLARWRARTLAAFFVACATLGLAPYISLVLLALETQLWGLLTLDTTIIVSVYVMLFSRRVSNDARALALTVSSFAIGTLALVSRGPVSASFGWLFMSVFLASFLLGKRATTVTVVGTLLVLLGVATGIRTQSLAWAFQQPDLLRAWVLTTLNFAFLIVVFAVTNVTIIGLLEREDRARAVAEAQLAEARRHEALGTLAGGIAHDFNNLLVPMLVNVSTVHDALPADSPERPALLDARRSAERARDLVQRILTFGRGMDTERGSHDLQAMAGDAVALLRYSAPAQVVLTHDAGPPAYVRASAAELHQVCQNLISNGLHAVAAGGTVTVAVRSLTTADGSWQCLTVSDDGVGFDARTRDRLFDPYFSTRPAGSGTGLGLPIVHGIVRSLGGRIDVSSHPGRGSVFSVFLPAVPAPDAQDARGGDRSAMHAAVAHTPATHRTATHTPDARAAGDADTPSTIGLAAHSSDVVKPLEGVRVLLVDDDEAVLRATSRLLTSLGGQSDAVSSAAAALDRLRETPAQWHVLLTDYRMPGRTGVELAQAIRALPLALPIVLASGHLADVADEHLLPDDLVRLAKPFTREALTTALRQALAASAPHHEAH